MLSVGNSTTEIGNCEWFRQVAALYAFDYNLIVEIVFRLFAIVVLMNHEV